MLWWWTNLVTGTHHLTDAQVGVQFGVLGKQVLQGLLADSSLQSFGRGAIGYNSAAAHKAN